MARYAYNVNTQTKLLDLHKQFRGGLKTVDSDDALGDIFLRDVHNLSLSEFGFLEKRYGQYIKETILEGQSMTDESKVQAFFEYKKRDGTIDEIIIIDGKIFLNGAQITQIKKQDLDLKYPDFPSEWFTITGDEDIYNIVSGTFNTGQEMEGTRIDDTLYIFTGVYPIYYIGDNHFYFLPVYEPEFLEIQEFSHNRLEDDFDTAYYNPLNIGDNSENNQMTELVRVKEFEYYPRLPYNTGTGSGFRISASYEYNPESVIASNHFVSFMDEGVTDEPVINTGSVDERNTDLYELFFRVATRTAGGTELEWQELDPSVFTNFDARSNSYTSATPNYQRADATQDANVYGTYSNGIISQGPLDFTITKLPVGLIDIKIEVVLRQSGYLKVLGSSAQGASFYYDQIETILESTTVRDIFVAEEKIEDYADYITDDDGYPSLWSCNKVLNHYGKLMAYGSASEPQRVFISHPTYKNYFPHYFTQLFTTEERDPILKITPFSNILVVQSEDYTWGLKGTDALPTAENPYSSFTISPIYGTIAPKSVKPVRNYLVFLSKEGIVALKSLYAVDEQYNVQPLDDNIYNIVPQDEDAVAIQFDDQYWIQFPNSENNMTLRYDVDKKAWMKDTYFNKISSTENSAVEFNGIFKYLRRTGVGLTYISQPLLYGDNYAIYEIAFDETLPTDLGEPYFTSFETSYLSQNYPFHLKNYKETKLELNLINEYNLGKDPVAVSEETVYQTFHQFQVPLVKNHEYQLTYYGQNTGTSFVSLQVSYDGFLWYTLPFTEVTTGDDFGINFLIPNIEAAPYHLKVIFNQDPGDIHDTLSVYDTTFDQTLAFKVWVLSEQGTLNLDNLEGYEEEKAEIGVSLGTQFGTWEFGESDFGTRIDAVRTIKLSGKGYNSKVYFEDYTKSKWTLQSLGIVYKLKKARNT